MMTSQSQRSGALETLLDLDQLALDSTTQLTFQTNIDSWVWAVAVLLTLSVSVWSYARLSGNRWARLGLACVRTSLIMALLILIAGPQLAQRVDTVEKDWVVVLLDRSASLNIEDVPASTDQSSSADIRSSRITREQQLREALEQASDTFASLAQDRQLVFIGYDNNAAQLALASDRPTPELVEPVGLRTSFAAAFSQAIELTAARPVAGIVLVSDGRSMDEPDRAVWRALRAEQTPVITVPLGSEQPVGDLSIARVEAPPSAFTNDGVPVRVRIDTLVASDQQLGFTITLTDKDTGERIDERRVETNEYEQVQEYILRASSEEQGERRVTVSITPDGDDLLQTNNQQEIAISYTARDLRVLFVDGYPRWEQRYLRQLLIREGSVNASTLILAPDRRYLQEGDTLIERIPSDVEDWSEYDVIMLGDVRPDVFTTAQLESLREHIARRGAGLILSGGPGAMPRAWFDTPLSEVLPFTRNAGDGTSIAGSALMQPTADANRLGLLRLNEPTNPDPWPNELETPDTGWSLLRYVQRLEQTALKPATQTLATAAPVLGGDESPLLLSMRFGAGRVVYVATDEIWRWRFGRGEALFERFWLQLLRSLGRERLERSGASVVLDASPERATVAQPVRVTLSLLDQAVIERAPEQVTARIQLTDDQTQLPSQAATIVLQRDSRSKLLGLGTTEGSPEAEFVGIWTPTATGTFTIALDQPDTAALDLNASPTTLVRVALPDDELRNAAADHNALRAIANRSGGSVLDPMNLSDLQRVLPNRERRQSFERTEPLWDTPLALIVLLLLATTEWIGRRLIRLT